MKISAGIAIFYQKKLLLCHPTNMGWMNCFSIPKGGVEGDESPLVAAIRETMEEVGITISPSQIENKNNPIEIPYINKKNEYFKKVYVFVARINNLTEIGLNNEILDEKQLQLSEVDWAGFMTKEESERKIFFRFSPLLNLIYENQTV